MKAESIQKAWEMANQIFPTDYEKDEESSLKAGYPIYRSTADGRHNDYICDLNDRLELNLADGNRTIDVYKRQTYGCFDDKRVHLLLRGKRRVGR